MLLLLLLVLGQPARFEAAGAFGCPNTLQALCRQPKAAGVGGSIRPHSTKSSAATSAAACAVCAGRNQHALRVAGCEQADIELFCAAGVGDPSRPNVIFVLTVRRRRATIHHAPPPQVSCCLLRWYSSPVVHRALSG